LCALVDAGGTSVNRALQNTSGHEVSFYGPFVCTNLLGDLLICFAQRQELPHCRDDVRVDSPRYWRLVRPAEGITGIQGIDRLRRRGPRNVLGHALLQPHFFCDLSSGHDALATFFIVDFVSQKFARQFARWPRRLQRLIFTRRGLWVSAARFSGHDIHRLRGFLEFRWRRVPQPPSVVYGHSIIPLTRSHGDTVAFEHSRSAPDVGRREIRVFPLIQIEFFAAFSALMAALHIARLPLVGGVGGGGQRDAVARFCLTLDDVDHILLGA
jgi:hypothetical protein